MGDESLRLQEQHEDAAGAELVQELERERMEGLYAAAKAAKVGTTITCPWCERRFTKRSYQQAFCSNRGRGNCKDSYWNRATPERLERAQHFA